MVETYVEELLNSFYLEVKNEVVYGKGNIEKIRQLFLEGSDNNVELCEKFLKSIPFIKENLSKDLDFFVESDPAIISKEEVVLAYPGFKAITVYRIAHELLKLGFYLNARMLTEKAHSLTGIDIHPGASISAPFFIDHGTGIVIGETTIIGRNVKLYQSVTLGALSLAKGSKMKGIKRHPTIGDYVTIYAGASILGDVKIGNHVTIGSNVFLTDDVPDNTRVTISKPELIVSQKNK